MTAQRSMKPATELPMNGLQEADQRAEQINFQASHFPGDSQPHPHRSGPTPVWSAEFPINQREFLRVELRQHRTHAAVDLRRWRRSPGGDLLPTSRGFAVAARHLLTLKAIIDTAAAHARADGLPVDTVQGGAP
jgi:hypothetical protein